MTARRERQHDALGVRMKRKDIMLEKDQVLFRTQWGWEIWKEGAELRRLKRIPMVAVLQVIKGETQATGASNGRAVRQSV